MDKLKWSSHQNDHPDDKDTPHGPICVHMEIRTGPICISVVALSKLTWESKIEHTIVVHYTLI